MKKIVFIVGLIVGLWGFNSTGSPDKFSDVLNVPVEELNEVIITSLKEGESSFKEDLVIVSHSFGDVIRVSKQDEDFLKYLYSKNILDVLVKTEDRKVIIPGFVQQMSCFGSHGGEFSIKVKPDCFLLNMFRERNLGGSMGLVSMATCTLTCPINDVGGPCTWTCID